MDTRPALSTTDVLIGTVIVLAIIVGVVALLRMDPWGGRPGGQADATDEDLQRLRKIDQAMIGYQQTGEIPLGMQEVRALAVGPERRLYVAGDRVIEVFDPAGRPLRRIALTGQPSCLAVGGPGHAFPGRVYVGVDRHVELYDADLPTVETAEAWADLGQKAVLTSLALAEDDVFVADAGNKIVWHCDASGALKGRIGQRDEDRGVPGFVVPSPYLDVAMAPDGLLRVSNPGMLRVEAYTFDGHLEGSWGKGAATLEGFFGCCNPAQIAVLADGRVVTAEKGVPRIKVYGADGRFSCVVAGPEQLDAVAADLAVDGQGRVFVLDPEGRRVVIFEPKQALTPREQ